MIMRIILIPVKVAVSSIMFLFVAVALQRMVQKA